MLAVGQKRLESSCAQNKRAVIILPSRVSSQTTSAAEIKSRIMGL
jgi:hypothetical protein